MVSRDFVFFTSLFHPEVLLDFFWKQNNVHPTFESDHLTYIIALLILGAGVERGDEKLKTDELS